MLIASGSAVHPQCHDFSTPGFGRWILAAVWSGTATMTVGGRSLLCPPGALLLVRAGTPYRVTFAQGGHETWIFFQPPAAWRDLLIWPEAVPGVALRITEQKHDAALREAVREAHAWWSGSERQRLWLATNALERGLLVAALDLPGTSLAGIDPALAALVDWLAHGPPEPLDVAALARRVGWSPSHFAHRFREQLGVAPLTWLEARRIEQAKRLLLTTSLAIKAIAAATGFRDSQHLVRRFRLLVGCTPGGFRRDGSG